MKASWAVAGTAKSTTRSSVAVHLLMAGAPPGPPVPEPNLGRTGLSPIRKTIPVGKAAKRWRRLGRPVGPPGQRSPGACGRLVVYARPGGGSTGTGTRWLGVKAAKSFDRNGLADRNGRSQDCR